MNNSAQKRPGTPRRPWRLQTRLALALLIVFLPLCGLLLLSHLENQSQRRVAEVQRIKTIGETISAGVDGSARDLDAFTRTGALMVGVASVPIDSPMMNNILKRITDSVGTVRAIFITDLDGRVVSSSRDELNGLQFSGQNFISDLENGSETAWSGVLEGQPFSESTLMHGRLIRTAEGVPTGFLVVNFPLSMIVLRLPQDLPADANLSLIDSQGQVLFDSRGLDAEAQRSVTSSPVFAAAQRGKTALIESGESPLDDDKRYGAFVPVERTGWVVGFTRPASAIDEPLANRSRRDLLLTFGALSVGFGLMLASTSRLSRPLSTLADAAAAIARGERPVVPMQAADAHVLKLEQAMGAMSQAVIEREDRLRVRGDILATLDRLGLALATELDLNTASGAICEAVLELTGAEVAGCFVKPVGAELRLLSVSGSTPFFPLPANDSLVRRTIEGEALHISDLPDLPDAGCGQRLDGDGSPLVRSLLSAPFGGRNRGVRGGLVLLHSEPDQFNDYHKRLTLGLANWAGVIVENASLYSEARRVQEELRKANVAKDEFVGVISHELRTPLTTIYGGVHLLQSRRSKLSEIEVEEMIGSIMEESERLYNLVENLLVIARTDLGAEIPMEIVSVSSVVTQTVKRFSSEHPGRAIDVRIDGVIPLVLAQATYLSQVLHNLITNADKYSGSGMPIEVLVSSEGEEVTIRVLDRGPGVAPEELDHIFEGFYRSSRTAGRASGKGMGLTVCKRLVEAMSGRIGARPRVGGGLEVGFSLPVASEAVSELH